MRGGAHGRFREAAPRRHARAKSVAGAVHEVEPARRIARIGQLEHAALGRRQAERESAGERDGAGTRSWPELAEHGERLPRARERTRAGAAAADVEIPLGDERAARDDHLAGRRRVATEDEMILVDVNEIARCRGVGGDQAAGERHRARTARLGSDDAARIGRHPAYRRQSNCSDSPNPGSKATTSVRPEEKLVPWKSWRSKRYDAVSSSAKPRAIDCSRPTAAR